MSLGQLNGLDTNALMSQSLSPSTTLFNADSAQDAGVDFLSQTQAGQFSSVSINTPSIAKATSSVSDRLAVLTTQNRGAPTTDTDDSMTKMVRNNTGSKDDGESSSSNDANGDDAAEGLPGTQVIPPDSSVTQADLQNMSYDYNNDGAVTVEEAEIGQAIEAATVQVGIMIGGQSVMNMRTQMERDRALSERIARGG